MRGAELTPVRFLVIWTELGLVLAAAYALRIEQTYGFARLLPVIFAGFAVNAWAPLAYRPIIFLALSVISIWLVAGPVNSLWLLGAGLTLFGFCHVPGPVLLRVFLLVAAGLFLAAVRLGWIPIPSGEHLAMNVIPVLAAMFMFRLAAYLYDIRHERQKSPGISRLSYFFMLPNACFPLFPVIDFRAFSRGYYDTEASETYQKGVRWFMRGIVHLLIYRIVYYHYTPTFEEIDDLLGVTEYVISSYLLYLRVSGMFHIIVGTLCLFGFNLPETHRMYFLASSFTDFWRRINIYWKDFMVKVLYYPLFTRLKHIGVGPAILISSLVTLIASWMLHSYQIFWLRGSFPVLVQDAAFWSILGLAVAINSLIEYRSGRERDFASSNWTAGQAFILSVKTALMFCLMSLLWSFWTSSSIDEWLAVMQIGLESSKSEKVVLASFIAGVIVLGTIVQLGGRWRWVLSGERQPSFAKSAATTSLVAILAALLGTSEVFDASAPEVKNVLASLRANRPNLRDEEIQNRGYYEELLGAEVPTQAAWSPAGQQPRDWMPIHLSSAARDTGDLLRYELVANVDIQFKGARLRTNSFGMRDREYALAKPPETCRFALFGDSYSMGAGIDDEDIYPTLVENRLNEERPLSACPSYELLNFAVGGYSVIQSAIAATERISQFSPDVVLYVTAHDDFLWAAQRLSDALQEGASLDSPFFQDIRARTGISANMNVYELRRRLKPVASDLAHWAYVTIVQSARAAGARAVWLFLPARNRDANAERRRYEKTSDLARKAGFTILSLQGVWDGHDVKNLRLAPWDGHPNTAGHALIAEQLYAILASAPALVVDEAK